MNDNLEKYSHEKAVLSAKLSQAREEKELFAHRAKNLEAQLSQKKTAHSTGTLSVNLEEKVTRYFLIKLRFSLYGNLFISLFFQLQHFYGKYLRSDSRRKALVYQKRYLLSVLTCYQRSEENTLTFLSQLTQTQRTCIRKSSSRKNPRSHFRSVALVIISIHRMKFMIMRWRTGRRVGATAILDNPEQSFIPIRPTTANHSPPIRDNQSSKLVTC